MAKMSKITKIIALFLICFPETTSSTAKTQDEYPRARKAIEVKSEITSSEGREYLTRSQKESTTNSQANNIKNVKNLLKKAKTTFLYMGGVASLCHYYRDLYIEYQRLSIRLKQLVLIMLIYSYLPKLKNLINKPNLETLEDSFFQELHRQHNTRIITLTFLNTTRIIDLYLYGAFIIQQEFNNNIQDTILSTLVLALVKEKYNNLNTDFENLIKRKIKLNLISTLKDVCIERYIHYGVRNHITRHANQIITLIRNHITRRANQIITLIRNYYEKNKTLTLPRERSIFEPEIPTEAETRSARRMILAATQENNFLQGIPEDIINHINSFLLGDRFRLWQRTKPNSFPLLKKYYPTDLLRQTLKKIKDRDRLKIL